MAENVDGKDKKLVVDYHYIDGFVKTKVASKRQDYVFLRCNIVGWIQRPDGVPYLDQNGGGQR